MRIAELAEEKLHGEADVDGGIVRARLCGTASQRHVAALEDFLAAIVRAVAARALTAITLDVRDLTYMNSAHFKLLVSLVARLQKHEPPVTLRLQTNDAVHWQKRSLPALKHLADDLVLLD
jgi:hypothetical protein